MTQWHFGHKFSDNSCLHIQNTKICILYRVVLTRQKVTEYALVYSLFVSRQKLFDPFGQFPRLFFAVSILILKPLNPRWFWLMSCSKKLKLSIRIFANPLTDKKSIKPCTFTVSWMNNRGRTILSLVIAAKFQRCQLYINAKNNYVRTCPL